MNLKVMLEIEIRDKNGQLKSFCKKEANSFVRGFIDVLFASMNIVGTQVTNGMLDTSNGQYTAATSGVTNSFCQMRNTDAGAGVTNYGIVAGTGINPVAISDYALQTLIAHGAGAGQLSYGAMEVDTNPNTGGSTRSFIIKRQLTNNSGNDITINELGLYVFHLTSGGAYKYVCVDRTLQTQTVLNLATAVIKYTIGVTV